jgi:hypothetical protein
LQVFAGFESNRFARRDIGDFAGPRVAANAALAGFYHEYTEAAKLNALSTLKRCFHRFEQRLDSDLGLHLWNAGSFCHVVYYIQLNHESLRVLAL